MKLKSIRHRISWEGLLTVLLLLLLGINFLLVRRVNLLSEAIVGIKAEGKLRPGDMLTPFEAVGVDGRPVVLNFQSPTVLYILTPKCPWCIRNTANVNAAAQVAARDYEFIGLSLDQEGLPEHIAASGYKFPIYTSIPFDALMALKAGGTPQTVVVAAGGKVISSWTGAFTGENATQVEAHFQIRLPGLLK